MIPTGSVGLDNAMGGGWPLGTLNELWGDPGAGKTVLALHAVESAVRARQEALWVDTVDGVAHMTTAPRVIVARIREAETAFAVMGAACIEPSIGLIVVDSANYLVRRAELDGDPDFVPHPQREYKDELNVIKRLALTTGTVVLFVSQPRDKERQPIRGTGISEKVRYRVHLHPDVIHQDGTREIAATLKDVPGKLTTYNAARFNIRPGKGIDQELELVKVGVERGIIHRAGSWLAWNNLEVQGTEAMARVLRERTVLTHDLYNEIRVVCTTGR